MNIEILISITYFAIKNMLMQMSSANSQPFYLSYPMSQCRRCFQSNSYHLAELVARLTGKVLAQPRVLNRSGQIGNGMDVDGGAEAN